MSRRQSICALGLADESLAELELHDENFFGFRADSDRFSSSSEDDDADIPAAQRICVAASAVDDSDEEQYSPDSRSSVNDSPASPDTGDQAAGLMEAQLRDVTAAGCGCSSSNHFADLSGQTDVLVALMLSVRNLSKPQMKQYVLGELAASLMPPTQTAAERRYRYSVLGVTVCQKVFLEVHGISTHTLKTLQKLAAQGTAAVPDHSLKSKVAHNLLSKSTRDAVVQFLLNYGCKHGLPQPCTPRGKQGIPPVYIPASHKKSKIFEQCSESLAELDPPCSISYRSFLRLWTSDVSHIKVMKRRSDVCAMCEMLRQNVSRARNEEETQQAMTELRQHMERANIEREYYKTSISQAAETLDAVDIGSSHITFDFAQQLELPCHTREVGPLYFKVCYRVQVFGVVEEAKHCQWNFLFGEQHSIGQDGKKSHGPNSVVSMLHYYLEMADTKRTLHLHADNCMGQNKNKTVLGYLMWRCATGLNDRIGLSFMRVGHTRCAVDGYFGLLKQEWRKTENDTLNDVKDAVNSSCAPNKAVMHCWPWYEWDAFIANMYKPLKGILKYHHFVMSKDDGSNVECRVTPDSEPVSIRLLKESLDSNAPSDPTILPPILEPAGYFGAASQISGQGDTSIHFCECPDISSLELSLQDYSPDL